MNANPAPVTRIGSLFSGYGGLDHALSDAIGPTRLTWVCDNDKAATRLLAHHHPDVPNLGDITAVDWAQVEPVDVLTGGFPCQDVSHAGRRAGLAPGTRTGLWARMAVAIDHLRPALVVAENVRGLLSARADSDVEPCPWCLGDPGDGEPPLRALGAVLADLAELGYDAAWHGLRAADVGAAHGRFRVFIVAWPQSGDTDSVHRDGRAPSGQQGQAGSEVGSAADPYRLGREWSRDARGWGSRSESSDRDPAAHAGRDARPQDDQDEHPAPGNRRAAAHPDCDAVRQQPIPEPWRGGTALAGLTRPNAPPDAALGGHAPADTDHDAAGRGSEPRNASGCGPEPAQRGGVDWGAYEPAVRRWEAALGRPAPAPTEPSRKGGQLLSPRFVEWLMGCDDGWVCDVPGLSRNDHLRLLGNGVVRQQGSAAIRHLLQLIDQLRAVA